MIDRFLQCYAELQSHRNCYAVSTYWIANQFSNQKLDTWKVRIWQMVQLVAAASSNTEQHTLALCNIAKEEITYFGR